MKKNLLIPALIFMLTFTACGNGATETSTKANITESEALTTTEAPTTEITEEATAEQEATEQFTLLVINKSDLKCAYLRCNYYFGDEQQGMLLTDENDEGKIELSFSPEDFNITDDKSDLSDFRLELYLATSELPSEEAIIKAMQGEAGTETPVTVPQIQFNYGETYELSIVGNSTDGYELTATE